jgi:hypothetical protein
LRVGERGRCHVLGPRVQRRCDGVARICHYSPVAGKDLVGGPAEQEGVGALADLVDERRGLVVEERQSPSATLESALRSSSGPPRPCITPSRETFVMVVSFTVTGPFSWFGRPSVQAHRRTDLIDHGTVRTAAHAVRSPNTGRTSAGSALVYSHQRYRLRPAPINERHTRWIGSRSPVMATSRATKPGLSRPTTTVTF